MEASALHAPPGVARLRGVGTPFLRLRSDEQLVELFRAGHEDAFRVIHDRYRTRLFAYTRQMLPHSRQDAEDALQDVFIRAYSGLRANDRQLALRAWLYRVAHNRCVDQLRKNAPIPTEEIETASQEVSADPMAAVQQREDLRKLVVDVQRLPEQQRSALLLRELSGMSYQELAESLDLSIPAIKSLLVRARVGLAAAAEARDTACAEIRTEIVSSHERGVRPNALVRRHLTDCVGCREYRESVRGISRSLAALVPAGPIVVAAKLMGIGSVSAAASSSTAGGGAAAASGASAVAASGAAGAAGAGGAAASGAAAGAVASGGLAAGGAVAGGAVATGMTGAHLAALIAAAAATAATAGGAVVVAQTTPQPRHRSLPAHPAASVIHQAVSSGAAGAISPAAVVAPVAAVPASAPPRPAATPDLDGLRQGQAPARHRSTTPASSATTTTSTTPTTTPTPGATTVASGATAPGGTSTTSAGGSAHASTTTTPAASTPTGGSSTVPIQTDSTQSSSDQPGTSTTSGGTSPTSTSPTSTTPASTGSGGASTTSAGTSTQPS